MARMRRPPAPAPSPEDTHPGIHSPPPQGRPPAPSEVSSGIKPQFNSPTAPKPTGPPIPILQNFGVHLSIRDLNERVQGIYDAFSSHFGRPPSPGHVFDVLRAPVADFKSLYDMVPQTRAVAVASSALGKPPGAQGPVGLTPEKQFVNDVKAAIVSGTLPEFEHEHKDEFEQFLSDPKTAGKVFAEISGHPYRSRESYGPELTTHKGPPVKPLSESEIGDVMLAQAGISGDVSHSAKVGGGAVALGVTQIATALRHSPGGLWQTGKAVVLDEKDMLAGRPPKRTPVIAKETGKGILRDLSHPLANPGFLFMDALGFAGGGAGAVTRVARAGKAAAAGEGVGATARALATRPTGGTYELRVGDLSVHELQSENRAVALVQRLYAGQKNKALALRHNEGEAFPAGTLAGAMPERAREIIANVLYPAQKLFGAEAKVGRLVQARSRIEHILAMRVQRDLEAVSGWSVNSARVFSRLPAKARKGLTRGEQKAIQVLATDDPNPLQLHRDFHDFAIEAGIGEKAAHERQLRDLTLAERALSKPSPRFEKALDLTRQVMEEQQRVKIADLGLSPVDAESRVAAPGQMMREQVRSGEARQSEQSFYLPFVSKAKSKRPVSERFGSFQPRFGPYGMGVPETLPELRHYFTGDAILAGDYRIDATHLASETYARTIRASHIVSRWKELWGAARTTRPTGPEARFYRPIRDVRAIPDKLKEIALKIDEGELTATEASALHPNDAEALIRAISPEARDLAKEDLPHVRWVDERLTGDLARVPPLPTPGKRILQTINEPFRAVILYLRPAYALNAVGNTAMGLVHQGPLLPLNVARAIFKQHLYGEDAARTLSALVGETRSKSYVADVEPFVSKAGRNLAQVWSFAADKFFREASLIHELRRQFRSDEEIRAALTDKAHQAKLHEAVRRANKAMVEFDNLTWFEKNTLRHFVFVYPWVSRSLVWSLRTLVEHPIQSDMLVHLGEMAQENEDPVFKHAPEWFKRTGYFPVSWKDGKPAVVNPTSVNTFSTIGQLLDVGQAGFFGGQYSSIQDLLGPGALFTVHAATGRDEFGNPYPGSQWLGAAKEALGQLPQAQAVKRGQKANAKLPPLDLTKRTALSARERAALKQTVFSPGFWDGYGTLFSGGLTPRVFDPEAAAARYWQNQPWQDRHAHEMKLIREALSLQGGLLGEKVPKPVRDAVNLAGSRDYAYKAWAQEHGRNPTTQEKIQLDLKVFLDTNRLNQEDASKLRAKLEKIHDPDELDRFRRILNEKYGQAQPLREWDADVRLVHSFTPEIVQARLDTLASSGLISKRKAEGDQQSLHGLGREVLAYLRQVREKTREARNPALTSAERSRLMGELRVWQDEQDKPIRVGSKTYPSPVKFAWSLLSARDRASAIASAATSPWESLSAFDRKLLGRKSDSSLTRGWQTLKTMREVLLGHVAAPAGWAGWGALPAGQRKIGKDYQIVLAKYVGKYGNDGKPIDGFYKDYLFAQQPLYRRLEQLKPVQQSPHKAEWQEVLVAAAQMDRYRNSTTKSGLHDAWRDYVTNVILPYVSKHPGFQRELSSYGQPHDFLDSLLK